MSDAEKILGVTVSNLSKIMGIGVSNLSKYIGLTILAGYSPPQGDQLNFNFGGSYTPPGDSDVNF